MSSCVDKREASPVLYCVSACSLLLMFDDDALYLSVRDYHRFDVVLYSIMDLA